MCLNEKSYSNKCFLPHGSVASKVKTSSSETHIRLICQVLLSSAFFPMAVIRRLVISPPLMNSSSPGASEQNQLQELFDSPHTGGVTTRTATLTGFKETSEHTVCL